MISTTRDNLKATSTSINKLDKSPEDNSTTQVDQYKGKDQKLKKAGNPELGVPVISINLDDRKAPKASSHKQRECYDLFESGDEEPDASEKMAKLASLSPPYNNTISTISQSLANTPKASALRPKCYDPSGKQDTLMPSSSNILNSTSVTSPSRRLLPSNVKTPDARNSIENRGSRVTMSRLGGRCPMMSKQPVHSGDEEVDSFDTSIYESKHHTGLITQFRSKHLDLVSMLSESQFDSSLDRDSSSSLFNCNKNPV